MVKSYRYTYPSGSGPDFNFREVNGDMITHENSVFRSFILTCRSFVAKTHCEALTIDLVRKYGPYYELVHEPLWIPQFIKAIFDTGLNKSPVKNISSFRPLWPNQLKSQGKALACRPRSHFKHASVP
ncbi:hypothetical protein RRG08_039588 [Elysia crispata]|uniref:Uncharacterized protein n=1 Tax=Elysia crispata TaxID=231223 RepID=A0AAE1AK42_9GAST|nr:hypothetical protein RRG08_039588 [Elysia crispata]